MFFKITVLALFVALAHGSALHGSALHGGHSVSSFSYGVSDPHTGDVKNQHEKRVGDSVVGQYSLLESDGTKRVVDYVAHPHTGFNAVVRKDPVAIHPSSALVAPLAYGNHGLYGGNAYGYGSYATPYSYAHQTPTVSAYSTSVAHHGGYGAGYAPYNLGHSYGGLYGGYGSLAGYAGYAGYGSLSHHGLTAPLAHGYGYGAGSYGAGSYGYGAGLW